MTANPSLPAPAHETYLSPGTAYPSIELDPSEGKETISITLPTLEDLENFWQKNRHGWSYACEGIACKGGDQFLQPCEWVFGNSKAAVARSVMRLGQSGFTVEYYEWAKLDPESHEDWFIQREFARSDGLEEQKWIEKEEAYYRARTRETYRGWWQFFKNGEPLGWHLNNEQELIDRTTPQTAAEDQLLTWLFEDWATDCNEEIRAHTATRVDEIIAYWHEEKANGRGYYGSNDQPDDE